MKAPNTSQWLRISSFILFSTSLFFLIGCSDNLGGISESEFDTQSSTSQQLNAYVDENDDGIVGEASTTFLGKKLLSASKHSGNGNAGDMQIDDATKINFETPALGSDARLTLDPYIDEASGIEFTAVTDFGGVDGVVGLVKNLSTSACVDPPDGNQKLGTAPGARPGFIGLSAFPIKATFPQVIHPPVRVTVSFQSIAGSTVRVTMFDDAGNEVARTEKEIAPSGGTCGFPGDPTGREMLAVSSNRSVAYVIMENASNSDSGGFVTVIDDFTINRNPRREDDGLDDGLVAYYPFNGNAQDASATGNDGTVFGASLAADKFGNDNSAYSFDGINDYILVSDDNTLDISESITIAAWIKPVDTDSDYIVGKRSLEVGGNVYSLDIFPGTMRSVLQTGIGAGTASVSGSSEIVGNEWQHIAVTWDGETIKGYYNGLLEDTRDYSGLIKLSAGDVEIGRYSGGVPAPYFNGLIDEVRIYNTALSQNEILDIMNQGEIL
ncbi:MAG: LamG domain-containing protein [Rhodothermales bacterium]